jgi:hypothetical protein
MWVEGKTNSSEQVVWASAFPPASFHTCVVSIRKWPILMLCATISVFAGCMNLQVLPGGCLGIWISFGEAL